MAIVGENMLPPYRLLAHDFVGTSTAQKKKKKDETNTKGMQCFIYDVNNKLSPYRSGRIFFLSPKTPSDNKFYQTVANIVYRFSQVAIAISCVLCNVLLDLFIYMKNKTLNSFPAAFIDDQLKRGHTMVVFFFFSKKVFIFIYPGHRNSEA